MKERLIAFAKEITEKAPISAVMRHSIREEIVDHRQPWLAMLTEEGREWARFFGTLLPINRKITFYSSPIERCVETASLIAAGVTSIGGNVAFVQPFNPLAEMFCDSVEACLEAIQLLQPKPFFSEWTQKTLALEPIQESLGYQIPLKNAKMLSLIEVNRILRETLLAEALPDHLNIFVTHDYHLSILRHDWKTMAESSYFWPPLLGGLLLDPRYPSILTQENNI